jgi:putative hydrolase of the HAD superfamily
MTAFSHAFQPSSSSRPGPTTNETIEFARWRQIVRGTLFDLDERSSACAFNDLWNHFADPRHWRAYPDVLGIPDQFAARGVRLAVASNLDARLEPILHHLFGEGAFEQIFVSSRIGWSKPDPRFFKEVARLLGCDEPGMICMIGDDPVNDVQAPLEVGWNARLIAR